MSTPLLVIMSQLYRYNAVSVPLKENRTGKQRGYVHLDENAAEVHTVPGRTKRNQ